MPAFRSMFVFALVLAATTACRETPLLAPEPGVESGVSDGAVRVDIVEGTLEADGSQTLVVRLRARSLGVSSYQGTLSFTPGSYELLSITTPDRSGESYLFNTEEFAAGRLRFAALSLTTFAGANMDSGIEAFRVTVRPLRPAGDADLAAQMEVAGLENGMPLTPDQLLPSRVVRGPTAVRGK